MTLLVFFSLLSQFGVVGMDLVNCLPLSLPSYRREMPGLEGVTLIGQEKFKKLNVCLL